MSASHGVVRAARVIPWPWVLAGALLPGTALGQEIDTDTTAGMLSTPFVSQVSQGTGTDFGGMLGGTDGGIQVELLVETDTLGRIRFESPNIQSCMRSTEFTMDVGVIYIDSAQGGFADTTVFTENSTVESAAISGMEVGDTSGSASDLDFPIGFEADFAVVLRNTDPSGNVAPYAELYELATGSLSLRQTLELTQPSNDCQEVVLEGLGTDQLDMDPGDTFRWIATLINVAAGYRSNEFHGFAYSSSTPVIGTNDFTVPDYNELTTVGKILINEIDTHDDKFIELAGSPNIDLTGTLLVLWDGSDNLRYETIDLDSQELDSNGYLLLGDAGVSPDIIVSGIQGGTSGDGVGYYVGDTEDVSDDNLADGLVYGGADSVLESKLLRVGSWVSEPELDNEPIEAVSRQRCPDNMARGEWSTTDASETNPRTPGSLNDCSVCGDGIADPVFEECDRAAGSCCQFACLYEPSGTLCRASEGVCDPDERCTGMSGDCPADTLLGTETVCRGSAGPCDAVEVCSGSDVDCPADANLADGTPCEDELVCNGAELCQGGVCMDTSPPDCDDGDACTADSCTESEGCTHQAIAGCCHLDGDCDDGDPCTTDVCDANECRNDPVDDCGDEGGGSGTADGSTNDGGSGHGTDTDTDTGTTTSAGAGRAAAGCGCRTDTPKRLPWWLLFGGPAWGLTVCRRLPTRGARAQGRA